MKKFVFDECKAEANWNMKNFIEDQVELICRQVGDRKVLLALSGGVDSSVVAAMLIKAIGRKRRERLSAENLSVFSRKKRENWKESISLDRERFIRTLSRAEPRLQRW